MDFRPSLGELLRHKLGGPEQCHYDIIISMVHATLDTHLRVETAQIPQEMLAQIQAALTFRNPEKEAAEREMVRGWQYLPDTVSFYDFDTGTSELVLPRGFTMQFAKGMGASGIPVKFDDDRVFNDSKTFSKHLQPIELRPHQGPAVAAIVGNEQGIYEAPPGTGKTVTALEVIRQLDTRSLIIIHKTEIAEQWRARAKEFLGANLGLIGDGIWEELPFTVALQQTLWSQRERLDEEGWWGKWGLVCLDECHHAPAETFQFVFQRFPARYRFGLSATPQKGRKIPIAELIIGPVIHRSPKSGCEPEIRVVATEFDFPFKSTQLHNGRVRRNNYQKLLQAIVEDETRNSLIASTIVGQRGHHNLVLSKRLKHLDDLRHLCEAYGWPPESIYMLRGKESREERMQVAASVLVADESIIFSTLADEALDIPPLDRLHLAFPERDPDSFRQRIGRIERVFDGKLDAIVFDYVDFACGVLKNQFRTRRIQVYNKDGLKVTTQ